MDWCIVMKSGLATSCYLSSSRKVKQVIDNERKVLEGISDTRDKASTTTFDLLDRY